MSYNNELSSLFGIISEGQKQAAHEKAEKERIQGPAPRRVVLQGIHETLLTMKYAQNERRFHTSIYTAHLIARAHLLAREVLMKL